MKKIPWHNILFICLLMYNFGALNAQTIFNGATVFSAPNSIVKINEDSLVLENNAYFSQNGLLVIDKDFYTNSGKTETNGNIEILGDLVNNDSIIGLSNTNLIELTGNWINNNIFIAGQNRTILNGNIQVISGTNNTTFYNLTGLGSLADRKELNNTNVFVLNELNLTNTEFATNTNELSILNTANTAILRNEGFVSSEGMGRLSRAVNSTQDYLFPTGSTNGTLRYRPIIISPNTTTANTFGVRLANLNPNSDFYNTANIDTALCDVNENFYHKIYGSVEANISTFYLPAEDGEWNTNAHWENSLWNNMDFTSPSNTLNFSALQTLNWNNYTSENFVLALKKPSIVLEDQIQANQNESVELLAFYNGPEPNEILWLPEENIDCATCIETNLLAVENGYYTISINATENCLVSDSVLLIVNPDKIFFPTGFSPNLDGTNDYFIPMNKNLEAYHLMVFNRWGEKVFETRDKNNGWNGKYKNQNAEIGVYSYSAEYRLSNQKETQKHKGSFTLLR